jgi:hypothetical protein
MIFKPIIIDSQHPVLAVKKSEVNRFFALFFFAVSGDKEEFSLKRGQATFAILFVFIKFRHKRVF